jgi:hypothetical protein
VSSDAENHIGMVRLSGFIENCPRLAPFLKSNRMSVWRDLFRAVLPGHGHGLEHISSLSIFELP